MAEYGIKVSKPGFDVKDSLGEDLVLFSTYNSPKIIQEAVGTQSFTGTAFTSGTVNHNLGYVPGYDFWADPGANGSWFSQAGGQEVGPGTNLTYYTEINSADLIVFGRVEGGGTINLVYHYLIYVDPGA